MEFYTYIWRDANGVPFYVGKGRGKRAWDTKQRSKYFKAIHGLGGCMVEIVDFFIHESQAHAHEVELIELYGRLEFGGSLVNKTDGGEGASGFLHSADSREKIGAAHRGKNVSPETRIKLSKALTGKALSPEHRLKLRVVNLGKTISMEQREKLSEALRGKSQSPEHISKNAEARRGKEQSPDSRAKNSAAQRLIGPNARNKSGFKGVHFSVGKRKWAAFAKISGSSRHIGYFSTPEEAALAYDAAAVEAWGVGNCYLNFERTVCLG